MSAEYPDVLAALRDKFADLLAEAVAEPVTYTANAAARDAAEAAAKKITDLRAQLVAKQAETAAAAREAAEAAGGRSWPSAPSSQLLTPGKLGSGKNAHLTS